MLTAQAETELFLAWQNAVQNGHSRLANTLHEKIIIQYTPIIKKVVKKMSGYKLDQDELNSEALMALVKSTYDFDLSLGFRFGTYAQRNVTLTLYTYIMKNFFITNVCINGKNKKLFFGLRRMLAKSMKNTDTHKLDTNWAENIAKDMGVGVDRVLMMNSMISEPYNSLNAPIGEEASGMTKMDVLESPDMPQSELIEQRQLSMLHKELITEALNVLDERTRDIVSSQILFAEGEKHTLEMLGDKHGISKERIRQLREAGVKKMHTHIRTTLRARHISTSDMLFAD